MKMVEISLKGKKTLWQKEKLLVTYNFSFSHNIFERLELQTRKNKGLFGKGLTHDQTTVLDWSKLKQIADDILKCI